MPVGKLNQERVREVATQEKAERNSNTFFQLKDGKNLVRVLPPPPGSEDVFFKTGTHWGIGPNKETFNCPAASDKNADCFLCDQAYKLSKSKSADDQALADKIRSKKSWLYNIVDLNDIDAGLQVMAVGITVHEKIRAYLEDEEGEFGDITDLEEGYDIRIVKEGTGNKTKYPTTEAKRKPSPIPPEIAVLLETESPVDLSTVRPVASVEKQKAAYLGEDEDEDDEDEEEEKTVRRRPAKAAKRVVEDDDDDDDDEEDEAPAPKKGKAARVVEDDDEEDEEDEEDDEDEDDAPAPKKTLGTRIARKGKGR